MRAWRMATVMLAALAAAVPAKAFIFEGADAKLAPQLEQLTLDKAKWVESIAELRKQFEQMRAMLATLKDFPLLREYRALMALYRDVQTLAWQIESFTAEPPDMADIASVAAGRRMSLERNMDRIVRIGRAAERVAGRAEDIGSATGELALLGQAAPGQTAALQTVAQQAALQTAAVQNETNTLLAMLQLQLAAEGRLVESELRHQEHSKSFNEGVPGWEDY